MAQTLTILKERASRVPPVTWVIAGGVAIGLYLMFRKPPKTPGQKQYLEAAAGRLEQLAKQYGIVPSLTDAQFAALASQVLQAVAKCGTDENTIYAAFHQLNNEADLMMLILKFDVQEYDGCFEGSLPFWHVNYTLGESITSDLSYSDISALNILLRNKGIQYSF